MSTPTPPPQPNPQPAEPTTVERGDGTSVLWTDTLD